MKIRLVFRRGREMLIAVFVAGHALAATFTEWQQRQSVEVPAPELVKVALPPLTLDDQRSPPAAFTGARLHAADAVDAPAEPVAVIVKSREEVDGDTRLVIDLGAANLTLAVIEFDTPEALFQREIAARVSEIVDEEIRESDVARGFIYALDIGNLTQARKTALPLDRQVRSRELILLIHNFDSPPLSISSI